MDHIKIYSFTSNSSFSYYQYKYDSNTEKLISKGSNSVSAYRSFYEDITGDGWYYWNGTKYEKCLVGDDGHPIN